MPTPVSSARQFLTEEAVRALDDAVAVAKRRSHAQTTSLHAVSALLALPQSDLRDACTRTKYSACSPRLQIKALELCVGVSLDRMPTTKTQEEPPISNSLMAAIKRSQANQRRHPETFHLYQKWHNQHTPNGCSGNSSSPPSISTVKVELKHFILSILDDPIVSRVFGDAGFISIELKFAILNPPTVSRFSKTRCPPLFLCNLSDLKLSKRGFNFPFSVPSGSDNFDGDSKRIGEVLVKKSSKNPLLVGVGAKDALNDFTDAVRKGKGGVLPSEIDGLCVVSLEKNLSDFLDGATNEETLRLKFQEVDDLVAVGQGAGVVVSFGDLKALVDGGESVEAVNFVVSQLSRLVEVHSGKLWLIGSAASYDTCMKFFAQFPTTEKDWDLHMMPFTSYKAPVAGVPSSTGLMGSFVPFGEFFSTPSDFDTSWSNRNPSAARCTICNEKYEQEAATFLKGGSTVRVAEQYSAPWLQIVESDKKKTLGIEEAEDDRTLLKGRLMALETKWNDICQHIHQNWSIQQKVSKVRLQNQNSDAFELASAGSGISIRDSLVDKRKLPDQNSCMPSESQNTSLTELNTSKLFPQISSADSIVESPVQQLEIGNFWNTHHVRAPLNQKTSVSLNSVTTDLGLGTLYASSSKEPSNPKFQEYKDRLWNSGSISVDTSSEIASNHVSQSSSCSVPPLREQPNEKDFKYIWRVLSEKVSWQDEAVLTLSRTVASCRNGCGQRRGQNSGPIWLSLLGPDKMGKRRIAAALAEALFGSAQNLLRVDLSSLGKIQCSNTVLDREDLKSYDQNFRAKTMASYVAEELSKKSESVVLLENVDKADVFVQSSLSQALKTGKFPNRGGREVSISSKVFVITSRFANGFKDFFSGNLSPEYSEERVLAATDLQMQIQIGCPSRDDAVRIENTNVMIISKKRSAITLSAGKRKFADFVESAENRWRRIPKHTYETTRSSFDLNLPVEDTEVSDECNSGDSDSGSESSKGWLEDFLDQMEGNVVLKPFDFDALSQKVLKEIDASFQKVVGSGFLLEIESEVVVQILAAAWLSERKKALEDWIQDVLYRSFEAASQRCNLTPDKVMKLVACTGLVVEDHSPGICLPARIPIV